MQSKLPKRFMDELAKARAEWDREDLQQQRARFAPISLKEAAAKEKERLRGKDSISAI